MKTGKTMLANHLNHISTTVTLNADANSQNGGRDQNKASVTRLAAEIWNTNIIVLGHGIVVFGVYKTKGHGAVAKNHNAIAKDYK